MLIYVHFAAMLHTVYPKNDTTYKPFEIDRYRLKRQQFMTGSENPETYTLIFFIIGIILLNAFNAADCFITLTPFFRYSFLVLNGTIAHIVFIRQVIWITPPHRVFLFCDNWNHMYLIMLFWQTGIFIATFAIGFGVGYTAPMYCPDPSYQDLCNQRFIILAVQLYPLGILALAYVINVFVLIFAVCFSCCPEFCQWLSEIRRDNAEARSKIPAVSAIVVDMSAGKAPSAPYQ
jgi:hypothetical protein